MRAGTRAAGEVDELELERLVRHFGARLVLGDHATHKPLVLADDALHLLLDGFEIFGGEGLVDAEVIVEAVGDGRPDAEVGLGANALHRLREDVRRGVAQDRQAVGAVDGDGLHRVLGRDHGCEVFQVAVHAQGDHGAVGEQREAVGGVGHVSHGDPSSINAPPRLSLARTCLVSAMMDAVKLALVGVVLLLAGGAAVASGVLPADEAGAIAERVWPILLFVVAVTIVAELCRSGSSRASGSSEPTPSTTCPPTSRSSRWPTHRSGSARCSSASAPDP
ncbi:hypothetical protein [Pseudoxanthomonas mexicana]